MPDRPASPSDWPQGDSEMARLIRGRDWSATPLGPIETWPQSLRNAVDLILPAGFPMTVLWGEELVQLYNDGYRDLMGVKHPQGLGQPTRRCWPEVWDINAPIYRKVLTGETLTFTDKLYPITRTGALEDAWFTLSYSPLRDDGAIAGVLVTVTETTERMREGQRRSAAEAVMRRSEERFRAFVNASSDVVYRMSPDWSQMRELDGRGFLADTAEPSLDWRDEYILPDDRATVDAAIGAAIRERRMFELEHRVRRADGTVGWTHSRAVPMLDESGAIVEWLGAAKDVTTRMRAEAALRESETRHRLLVESWAQAVWETDPQGVVIADSPSWRAYTGHTLDEWLGYGWLDAIHPHDRARAEREWREAMAAKTLIDAEFRLRSPKGGWRWTNVRAAPVLDNTGRIEKWAGMNVDIDARMRAEVALRASEERLRALFESIDEGFSEMQVILDGEGHVVDWLHLALNANFSRVTGIPDITGRLASEVFPNLEGEWFRRMDLAYRTGEPQRFETELAELGRWFNNYLTRLGGEDENRVFGVFADITERKLAERTLRERQEQQAFLLRLSDALRPLSNPAEITGTASRLLGEWLKATRVYFVEWPPGADFGEVTRDYAADGAASLIGRYPIEAFRSAYDRVSEGRTWIVEDNATAPGISDFERRYHQDVGVIAWVDVPLTKQGQPIAILCAVQDEPREWTAAEIATCEEAAERCWAAVERSRAEELRRRAEELNTLLICFSDAVLGLIDPHAVAEAACRMVVEKIGAERAYWAEVDWATREYVVGAAVHGEDVPAIAGRFRLDAWEPFTSLHLAGQPVVVSDTQADPRLPPAVKQGYADIAVGADLAVPVRIEGRLRSTLAVNQRLPRQWTSEEVALVCGIAGRCWSEVERARAEAAVRTSEERQAFLLKLSDALRPLAEAGDIEREATRLLGEHLEADRCFLTLVDEDGARLYVRQEYLRAGASSVLGDYHSAQFGDFVGSALHAGRILAVEDVAALPDLTPDERASYAAVEIAAYLLVPLVSDGRLAAYLTINHRTPRAWSEADQSIARQAADRAWAAVERVRAEAELRDSEERQAFLLRLADALRSLADGEAVQGTASRLLAEQLGVARAMYGDVEGPRGAERATVSGQYAAPGVTPWPSTYSYADTGSEIVDVLRSGTPVAVSDTDTDPRVGAELREAYAAFNNRSFIGVALIKERRWVATFGVNDDKPREWTPWEVALVQDVAERTWSAVERARAEAALRESEERFRQFGEASQDVLWIRDAETFQWEYLTPAFETIYGLDRAAALSGDNLANWAELIVPEDRDRALDNLRRVRGGEWVTFEYRIRRPSDGQTRWLRNTDFPIRDASGLVRHIGGIGHNVTELKRVEEALASTELRRRALIEGIPQLVWRAVDGGEWTWASPQWTEFTGQSEADSHGWGWLEPLHPDDRDTARAAWAEAMHRGGLDVEYRVRHSGEGGYRWFHTRASPVRDDRGGIVEWLGTSTDIHDLRELQERQKVLVAELQHRTRNLMGVVRSMSDKTARASADLPDFRERFRDRLEALARVQGLLSRLNEHDRVTFDELIRVELEAMQGDADRIRLEGPSGVRLRSSMVQTLAMAIHELATNAVKYGALGQAGAHLTVTWTVEPDGSGDRSRLHIDWRETGVAMPALGAKPTGGGQGRELIESALPYQLSAETTYELGPDGVHCSISIPISRSTSPREAEYV